MSKKTKVLRETFGTYISPDLIDKMYEEKQAPKLGGFKIIILHFLVIFKTSQLFRAVRA